MVFHPPKNAARSRDLVDRATVANTLKQLDRANLAIKAAEGELLTSERAMKHCETRFKHLQIGVAIFALTCFIAIAVEATIIVILLAR